MKNNISELQGERLLAAIKNIGVPEHGAQKWLGEQIGVSQQTVNNWMKNRQRINEKHVPKLIRVLSVDDTYFSFLAHPAVLPSHLNYGVNVPVLGWTVDSTLEKAKNNSAISHIICEKSLTKECFALQLEQDVISATDKNISFPTGSYIVVDPTQSISVKDGDLVIAIKKGVKSRLLKQYHSDREQAFLTDPNPLYPPITVDDKVIIEGVVVHAQINLK